jgi:hypothetical protein
MRRREPQNIARAAATAKSIKTILTTSALIDLPTD